MKQLLFGLILLSSYSLFAAECVVISGIKNDWNGAFSDRNVLNPKTSMIAGKKCKVLDGWKELDAYVTSMNLKVGSDLMIVLGAHGGSREVAGKKIVEFSCNIDAPNANQVMDELEKLSKTYKVGAVVDSCYSGDIMRKKIIRDHGNPSLADNLCLYTSSSMGRVTFKADNDPLSLLEKAKAGDTIEDMFLQTDAGMISSAAWEEVGVPEYLISKDLVQGLSAMENMDEYLRSPTECNTSGEINSALCTAPGITDEIYKDLMYFNDPIVPSAAKENMLSPYNIVLSVMNSGLNKNPKDQNAKNAVICYKELIDAYKAKFGESLDGLSTWKDLNEFKTEIKTQKFYAACTSYTKNDPVELDKLLMGDLYSGYAQYEKSVGHLKKLYTKTNWDDLNLSKFALASAGDKRQCTPASKQLIIQSLFGQNFFDGDFSDNSPAEMAAFRDINTQHMMKAFQNACMYREELPNPIDARRKKACANFKL
jgi:hypothetical protein